MWKATVMLDSDLGFGYLMRTAQPWITGIRVFWSERKGQDSLKLMPEETVASYNLIYTVRNHRMPILTSVNFIWFKLSRKIFLRTSKAREFVASFSNLFQMTFTFSSPSVSKINIPILTFLPSVMLFLKASMKMLFTTLNKDWIHIPKSYHFSAFLKPQNLSYRSLPSPSVDLFFTLSGFSASLKI